MANNDIIEPQEERQALTTDAGQDDSPDIRESEDKKLEADDAGEEISDEGVDYKVNTYGADYPVDALVKRFDDGRIFSPEFQRNYVWSLPQASKFIESILLGLPVPNIFLYREENTEKNLIVDGLQRLTTLHAFHKGQFRHNDKPFKLKNVQSRFQGCTLEDLEEKYHRRFEDTVIHAIIIQQIEPKVGNSSAYHIFNRINTGGTPLHPQEIRTAIYHGPFQKFLGQLNENPDWRNIFGPVDNRSKDQELILRFLAISHNQENYEHFKNMKAFMNNFMQNNRNAKEDRLRCFETAFENTIARARNALGDRAFRPNRSMNVAVFDAVMVAIHGRPDASSESINHAYNSLVNNGDFKELISQRTSNTANVHGRIKMAIEAIDAAK
ncbi:MAG: DUF262 domain-containing protein [Rhodobacteraceae bacterium]|nr:DUF262 domain-containing protein [Paracoccaceae bacterium]